MRQSPCRGGAALEALVLDGVDVFLHIWPEVLRGDTRTGQHCIMAYDDIGGEARVQRRE